MRAVLIGLLIMASPAQAQTAPKPVFHCQLGAKTVDVVLANGALVYRYGKGGTTPELEVRSSGKDGHAYYADSPAQRELFRQLRFINGDYSYIVYAWRGESGLAVVKGKADVSDRKCVGHGNGFSEAFLTSNVGERMDQDNESNVTIR